MNHVAKVRNQINVERTYLNQKLNIPTRFSDMPDVVHVYDFPYWKWPILRQCFRGCRIVFIKKNKTIPQNGCVILWGSTPVPEGLASEVRILRMEDGFLRSVGLGADLVKPVSWVLDGRGIYYNARQPSDLEHILATQDFDETLCTRAAALREVIRETGLTKYNTGSRFWERPAQADHVILVPGQVESDASITYGSIEKLTNMDLLRRVRAMHPGAYIVYKPHPDVLAKLRLEGQEDQKSYRWCNEIVTDVSMGDLLNQVDDVHVLTSLAGFEALLRNKPVTCYGQPFYSGWGLTTDVLPHERRTRRLTLDELIAGTLIEYPLYMSRDGMRMISVEEALSELLVWRNKRNGLMPWWRAIMRIFLRWINGVV